MSSIIMTYTGKMVDPLNLRDEDIDINDIAHSLSLLNRYTGHTIRPYSVAEHCYALSKICNPELAPAALLHDACEAYMNDLAWPVKQAIIGYQQIEDEILKRIFDHFEVEFSDIKYLEPLDRAICIDEMALLMRGADADTQDGLGLILPLWDWYDAKVNYLQRFYQLFDQRGVKR